MEARVVQWRFQMLKQLLLKDLMIYRASHVVWSDFVATDGVILAALKMREVCDSCIPQSIQHGLDQK